jgi:MOSC domain-containing protein YiiM
MRTLVRENHQALGVYGTVVEPGTVRVGDELTFVD